jgi:hypothetical protein
MRQQISEKEPPGLPSLLTDAVEGNLLRADLAVKSFCQGEQKTLYFYITKPQRPPTLLDK